jgi:hypothetical protein
MSTRAKHWLGIYALSLMLSAVSGCSSGSPRGGGGDAADAAPEGNSGPVPLATNRLPIQWFFGGRRLRPRE